jgi:hypothetical protein
MIYKLICDHYSRGKDNKLYGKKGDKVTMISESDTACVVENKLGKRFPIHKNLLQAI